ncbi:peroxiredoxin [Roseivivax sp. GX 12232]|uniref:peroxiredoxin n=1 Tax=Roseivivax sp. GX 12232 TaxID=2900547 RepID=UPI001E3973E7|nr:peroxiredoxin [Roseivivax sp. GX 12232]MCE0505621.1 peroxiredoxin [Roseivivax sp. GX 12232]
MPISVGDKLPEATLARLGAEGPEQVELSEKTDGRKVVIFALPGAFTPTCHSAHMPSFLRTREGFAEKGVDEVICIAVNDPFVLAAWDEATGAGAGGVTVLSDPEAAFTKAVGMEFSAPPVGFLDRSKRYAMLVEDGVVRVLHEEEGRGTCEISGGEAMLAAI